MRLVVSCSSKVVMMSLGRLGMVTSFMEQCKFHITFLMQTIFLGAGGEWTRDTHDDSDVGHKV